MEGLPSGSAPITLSDLEARLSEVEEQLSRRKPIVTPEQSQPGGASSIWSTIFARQQAQAEEASASASASSHMSSTVAMVTCCEKAMAILDTLMHAAGKLDWDSAEAAATVEELCIKTDEVIAAEAALQSLPPSAMREVLLQDARQLRVEAREVLSREAVWRLLSIEHGRVCLSRPRRTASGPSWSWTYARLLGLIDKAGGGGQLPSLARAVADQLLACLVDPLLHHHRSNAPDGVLVLRREVGDGPAGEVVVLSLAQQQGGGGGGQRRQSVVEAVEAVLSFVVDEVLEGVGALASLFHHPLILPLLRRLAPRLGCEDEEEGEELAVVSGRLLPVLERSLPAQDAALWRDNLLSLSRVSSACRQQRSGRTRGLARARERMLLPSAAGGARGVEDLQAMLPAVLCALPPEEEGCRPAESMMMAGALRGHTSRDVLAWLHLMTKAAAAEDGKQQQASSRSEEGLSQLGRRLEVAGHRARRHHHAAAAAATTAAFSPSLADMGLCLRHDVADSLEARLRSRLEALASLTRENRGLLASWAALRQPPSSMMGGRPGGGSSDAADAAQQQQRAMAADSLAEALSQAVQSLGPLPQGPVAHRAAGLCLVDAVMDRLAHVALKAGPINEEQAHHLARAWQALDVRCLQAVLASGEQQAREVAEGPRPWKIRIAPPQPQTAGRSGA